MRGSKSRRVPICLCSDLVDEWEGWEMNYRMDARGFLGVFLGGGGVRLVEGWLVVMAKVGR